MGHRLIFHSVTLRPGVIGAVFSIAALIVYDLLFRDCYLTHTHATHILVRQTTNEPWVY
jgi:hypothetical protein